MLNEGGQCPAGNLDVSEAAWVVAVILSKHLPDLHSVQAQAATAVSSVVSSVAASAEAFKVGEVVVSEVAFAAIEVIEVVMEEEEVLASKAEATLEVDHLPTLPVDPADEVGTADTKTDEMDTKVVDGVVGMAEVAIEAQPAVIEILLVAAETDTMNEIGMVVAGGTTTIAENDLTMATSTKIPDRNVGINGGTPSSVYQWGFRLLCYCTGKVFLWYVGGYGSYFLRCYFIRP